MECRGGLALLVRGRESGTPALLLGCGKKAPAKATRNSVCGRFTGKFAEKNKLRKNALAPQSLFLKVMGAMNTWCSMERCLRALGLVRVANHRHKNPGGTTSVTTFRLPADGTSCFRSIGAGNWCAGVPSTGTLRSLLRAAGLESAEGLCFPGDELPCRVGFLAVDTRSANLLSRGGFWKLRLWWLDGDSPRAFRLAGRFRKELLFQDRHEHP